MEAVGLSLTVAGFMPEILKRARHILESEQNSYELKKQKRKFDHYVRKVEAELRPLFKARPRPVPRDLLRASLSLVMYCRNRVVKAETFCKRFEVDPWTFRFLTHMARVFGNDKIQLLKRRLREGEDWLRIALSAVALHANFELAQEDIETRHQYRQRADQLRHDLDRAQAYRKEFPKRMKHMNKARVDYRCIASHAYAIANHPIFEGSESTSSSTTTSTASLENEHIDPRAHIHHSRSNNRYRRAGNTRHHDLWEHPVSANPSAGFAPSETRTNAEHEPSWTHDPNFHPDTVVSSHPPTTWHAPVQHAWPPQAAQPPLPREPPTGVPRSRQRQHAQVHNMNPGQAYQNHTSHPTDSVPAHQVPQAAVPSHGSGYASHAAYRPTYDQPQGIRVTPQQQEPSRRRRRTSMSPSQPSNTRSSSETPGMVDTSRWGEPHTTPTSLSGGHSPAASQPVNASTVPQDRRPRRSSDSSQVPSQFTVNTSNPMGRQYIHVQTESRSSSRSRSSSHTASSPSTTFSRTRTSGSSVPSSPATSFSARSSGSARDSGYSSAASVSETEMDKEHQHRPGDSHYPPNSHETRNGGYDAFHHTRRLRRERARREL